MKEEKTTNSAAPDEIEGENLDWEIPERQPKRFNYLNNLAWLGRDRPEGLEYWKTMEPMGRYASANHDIIQQSVLNHPEAVSVLSLENPLALSGKCSVGMRR